MYTIITDDLVDQQVAALPSSALSAFAELRTLLELKPWSGTSYNVVKPDAPMRTLAFGHAGMVSYLILEDQLRVDLVDVTRVE